MNFNCCNACCKIIKQLNFSKIVKNCLCPSKWRYAKLQVETIIVLFNAFYN